MSQDQTTTYCPEDGQPCDGTCGVVETGHCDRERQNRSPDPLDTPLPCAVHLPGMVFGKGVALRTLVNAAARWKARLDAIEAAKMAARFYPESDRQNGR